MKDLNNKRGTIAVLFALMMTTIIMVITGFGIDMGRVVMAKTQLQNAADAAALAGASALPNRSTALNLATGICAQHTVSGKAVNLAPENTIFGKWDDSTNTFFPRVTPSNAIQVTLIRAQASENPLQSILPNLYRRQTSEITATAIAVAGQQAQPIDFTLVLDRSGSMREEGGSKLQGVKNGANKFIDLLIKQSLPDNQGGVVWYNNDAYLASKLTDVLKQLQTVIDSVTATGWTSISEGLYLAINELVSPRANPQNKKVIVLLTDGRANTCIPLPATPGWLESPSGHGEGGCCRGNGPGGDNVAWDTTNYWVNSRAKREVWYLTDQAAQQGITIYTITLGQSDRIDAVLMQEVAKKTNGLYFTTDNPDNLTAIFTDIATVASNTSPRLVK